jgi:hypothetical protein
MVLADRQFSSGERMFRVPADADRPTFDYTFPVSFSRWLTSTAADRREWTRRRNAATRAATSNRQQRIAARYQHEQRHVTHKPTPAAYPVHRDDLTRTKHRLATIQLWLSSIELAAHLVIAAVVLVALVAVCGGIGWLLIAG